MKMAFSAINMQRFCCRFNTILKKSITSDPIWSNYGCKIDRIVLPSANVIQEHGYKQLRKTITYPKMRPLVFNSGDLVEQEQLPEKEIHYLYKDIKELEDAPEELKKLFTLEFANGPGTCLGAIETHVLKERQQHRHLVCQERIHNVVGADQNLEKYIAFLTVKIRNLMPYCNRLRQNKLAKVNLKEKIEKRAKLLRILSGKDYDRFLWLLKELKIQFKHKTREDYIRLTKKQVKEKEVTDEVLRKRTERLGELRERFAKEKEQFMEYKKTTLDEIDREIKEYNLDKDKLIKNYLDYLEKVKNPKPAGKTKFERRFAKW